MMNIELLSDKSGYPYDLLLLADETVEAINQYIYDSDVYLVKGNNNEDIGVFCLYKIDNETIELKNIAIVEAHQGKGLGSKIIDFIKAKCKPNYKYLIVGTADTGEKQIRFYQSNGFIKFDIRKDFFIDNYNIPIFENGKQLRDMILLKYRL